MTRRFSEHFWIEGSSLQMQAPPGVPATDPPRGAVVDCPAPRQPEDPRQIARRELFRDASTPRAVFVPRNYEENYAYPLIVWLHVAGGSERDLLDAMPRISNQNYVGLGLRGTAPANCESPFGFRWSRTERAVAAFENDLRESVCRVRRAFHVHSERIYLAGIGEGAVLGLTMLLRRPEWFAGAIALETSVSPGVLPSLRIRDLAEKRVFLASAGRTNGPECLGRLQATGRLLHAAGLAVSVETFAGADDPPRRMLRDVDRWIMDGIVADG